MCAMGMRRPSFDAVEIQIPRHRLLCKNGMFMHYKVVHDQLLLLSGSRLAAASSVMHNAVKASVLKPPMLYQIMHVRFGRVQPCFDRRI